MRGGGRSSTRTGLRTNFPANREKNREIEAVGLIDDFLIGGTTSKYSYLLVTFPTQVNRDL